MTTLVRRKTLSYNDPSYTFYELSTQSQSASAHVTYTSPQLLEKNRAWWRNGWDVPNFHARRKRGELLPMTPFHAFRTYGTASGTTDCLYTYVGGYSHQWLSDGNWIPFDDWILTYENFTPYKPDADDLLVYAQAAAAKIYSSGHDTLTFFAELADVRRMFLNLGERVLHDWPKRNYRFDSDWLQYRYGWRTLVMDLQDLVQAIRRLNSGKKRTRYSDRSGTTFETSKASEWQTSGFYGDRTHSLSDTISSGFRGSVTADIEIPDFQINPLITGWEVIPYSFVLDWFISVGKALAAISFLSLSPTYSASIGYFLSIERSFSVEMDSFNTGCSGEESMTGNSYAELRWRMPCDIPYLPRFNLRMNATKVMDLVALVLQKKF